MVTGKEERQHFGPARRCKGYPRTGDCMVVVSKLADDPYCNGCWMRRMKDKYINPKKNKEQQ